MKGLENQAILIAYIVSNVIGIIFVWAAMKQPKVARWMFFVLFAWASGLNYLTAQTNPEAYLSYGSMALQGYTDFINGWFARHVREIVTLIAFGQALIAMGMLLRGWWVKLACIGAVLFLMSIAPLGVGSAFPFSLTVSVAAGFLFAAGNFDFVWKSAAK